MIAAILYDDHEGVPVQHEGWIRDTIEMWVADYLEEAAGRDVAPVLLPVAEQLLVTFLFHACAVRGVAPGELVRRDLKEALLEGLQGLRIDEEARPKVPRLISNFCADLERRGRLANGEMLGKEIAAMREAFLESMSEKQKPVVRPSEKIGRNDPCPCGSGQKYKKCCMSSGPGRG